MGEEWKRSVERKGRGEENALSHRPTRWRRARPRCNGSRSSGHTRAPTPDGPRKGPSCAPAASCRCLPAATGSGRPNCHTTRAPAHATRRKEEGVRSCGEWPRGEAREGRGGYGMDRDVRTSCCAQSRGLTSTHSLCTTAAHPVRWRCSRGYIARAAGPLARSSSAWCLRRPRTRRAPPRPWG